MGKKTLKYMGGIFPTVFDIGEMWALNSKRCQGRFNMFFFWIYPLFMVFALPFSVLCLIERLMDE